MEGSYWAMPGADVSIAHHALPFEYVHGFVIVRKRASCSVYSAVVKSASKISLAGKGDPACYGLERSRRITEKVRHFASDAGQGVFVAHTVGKESTVCYYYGSLVYENSRSASSSIETYDESIMKMRKVKFLK